MIRRKRYAFLFFFALTSIGIIIKSIQCVHDGGMMHLFLGASQLLYHQINIYNHPIPIIKDISQEYSYSPFFALLLIPVSFFNGNVMEYLWLLLNVFFIYRCIKILSVQLNSTRLTELQKELIVIFTYGFSFRFILYNFGEAQMTIFLLYVCLEGFNWFQNKKWIAGSLLLALGVSIKILPVILIPYLIYRSYYKESIGTVLFIALFFIAPYIFFNGDYVSGLYHSWWNVINPTNTTFVSNENSEHEGVQRLSGLCAALFTNETQRYNITRNICEMNASELNWATTILRLVFVAITLLFIKSFPFRKRSNGIQMNWELSYLLLITPLIFPHQQKYAFVLIAPAVAFIIRYLMLNWKNKNEVMKVRIIFSFLLASFILTTLTTDGIIGRHLSDVANYFKLISYGTIILIIPLYLSKPEKEAFLTKQLI